MTTPIQLVPEHASHEVVAVLNGLLEAAKVGALNGIVFGASFKGQRYLCDAAGAMHRNPVLALGVAQMLTEELSHLIRREAGSTML